MKFYTTQNEFIGEGNIIPNNFTGIIQYYGGPKGWYLNGILHRKDGPAFVEKCGSKTWYFKGRFHRINALALEHVTGSKQWYIHDKEYTKEQHKLLYSTIKLKGLLNGF